MKAAAASVLAPTGRSRNACLPPWNVVFLASAWTLFESRRLVRQRVISLPKRLRGILADRPKAIAAVTTIFWMRLRRCAVMTASAVRRSRVTSRYRHARLGAWRVFISASVRIALVRLQLRVSCEPQEHQLRYSARLPFAMVRVSVIRGDDGRSACNRSALASIDIHSL